jgi:hypothetical protein
MPARWRTGRISSVPCAECGHKHDLRNMREMLLDPWSGDGISKDDQWFVCDNSECRARMEIVKVEPTTLISVRLRQK